LGADRFVPIASASEGSQGELLRDDSGKVVGLRFGLRLYRKVENAEHGPEA
jgi:hypothetical protein